MAIKFLSGQTITGSITVSANVQAATFNSLAINTTGVNNVANQIVRTESNGYANFGWINSVSGNHTGSITRITASNDAYLRYVTPAQFRTGVTDGFYAPSSTVSGVTSVATGNGLTGGTIISTGTLSMSGSYTGNFSVTGNVEIAQTGGTQLKIVSGDASGSQDVIVDLVSAFDYRGRGILYRNSNDSNKWFSGVPYNGGGYSIGYDNSQPEYKANSKLFVASSGNVGIGTTSPGRQLTLSQSVSGETQQLLLVNRNDTNGDTSGILFGVLDNATYAKAGIFFERTDLQARGSLHFATDNSSDSGHATKANARMTITHDGNVGIGTISPLKPLHVYAPDNGGNIRLTRAGTSEYKDISTYYSLTNGNESILGTTSAHNTFLWTNNYPALRITTAQEVCLLGFVGGDGFVLPQDQNTGYSNFAAGGFGVLFREAADNYIAGNAYYYRTGGVNGWRAKYPVAGATLISSNVGELEFQTALANTTAPYNISFTPRMVIKNNGNVGIGTTAPTSQLFVSDTVDGDKIRWGRSAYPSISVPVGSVGTYNGVPYIGYQGGAGGGIMFNGKSIEPTALGSTRSDNTNDIGSATYKWKNAYIGGGVFLGGTAAANKLDFYQQGIWTPTLNFGGNVVGITYAGAAGSVYRGGHYVKIGNVVTFSMRIILTSKGTSVGAATFEGLPYVVASLQANYGSAMYSFANNFAIPERATITMDSGQSTIRLRFVYSTGNYGNVTNGTFNNNSDIILTGTYISA